MHISEYKLFRGSHITGPGAVFLGLIFSEDAKPEPQVVSLPMHATGEKLLDVEKLLAEVRNGVTQANQDFAANLQLFEIQYIPNDYPIAGQVQVLSYNLAKKALGK